MHILICPDKFKGSLSAIEVSNTLSESLLSVLPDITIEVFPMADGGDGSLEIIQNYLQVKDHTVQTVDPLGRTINATYYTTTDQIALIELASASGLALLEYIDRNPMVTSTRGTGLMILDAIKNGYHNIHLFIGGSSTNDGGMGIAHALGYDFISIHGEQLDPVGRNLSEIHTIQKVSDQDFSNVTIKILCDVTNPMHGPTGAAQTYAAQKGASESQIIELDIGLKHLDNILQSQYGKQIADTPGMGAAGAVSACLVGLLDAKLQYGFQTLADITGLEDRIRKADLVITGEGKIDQTSFQGKVVGNILDLCRRYQKPSAVIGGMIDNNVSLGIDSIYHNSLLALAGNVEESMQFPAKYLDQIGKELAIMIRDNFST